MGKEIDYDKVYRFQEDLEAIEHAANMASENIESYINNYISQLEQVWRGPDREQVIAYLKTTAKNYRILASNTAEIRRGLSETVREYKEAKRRRKNAG